MEQMECVDKGAKWSEVKFSTAGILAHQKMGHSSDSRGKTSIIAHNKMQLTM